MNTTLKSQRLPASGFLKLTGYNAVMKRNIDSVFHWFHRHLLVLLLAANFIAIPLPTLGIWIRHVNFGAVSVLGHTPTAITLPMLMLACLLFNAGIAAKARELRHLIKAPLPLVLGVCANLLVPVVFIVVLVFSLQSWWHNPNEFAYMLAGFGMVAAMPIAGSSTAWSQNANGDVALSLGLVTMSTLFSPLTTPLILNFVGTFVTGDVGAELRLLAGHGSSSFLLLAVIVPSLLGIAVHFLLSDTMLKKIHPYLKLFNIFTLLLLSYSNASISLPQAFHHFDVDFLALILITTGSLCVVAFGSGWLLARIFRSSKSETSSLMFGLGMNNNGTGLVLSSMALANHPLVMLPIIFYNLIQQFVAGFIDIRLTRNQPNQ
jgi:BASS family bile acid:Na+ symporter